MKVKLKKGNWKKESNGTVIEGENEYRAVVIGDDCEKKLLLINQGYMDIACGLLDYFDKYCVLENVQIGLILGDYQDD